jgi:hypothetical protein
MDIKNLLEGPNVTVDFVEKSPTKKLIFLSAGAAKMIDNKEKMSFLVEIDGIQKGYIPNIPSMKVLSNTWGTETQKWVGKTALLSIIIANSRKAVNAIPAPPIREEVV